MLWTVVLEKNLESPLERKEVKGVNLKGNQPWIFIGRTNTEWSWCSNTLATWCEEITNWKRPWCWKRLRAGGEGDSRRWDGWMPSPSRWTWVCASSRSWWWTGKPGMLKPMGLQRVRHDWATKLNWLESTSANSHCLVNDFDKLFKISFDKRNRSFFYWIFLYANTILF